jgi:chromosomal replication initiation ATPase DnaA
MLVEQLSLKLFDVVRYRPDRFIAHRGVKEILVHLKQELSEERFSLTTIYAPKRSGKTHLAVYLADRWISAGYHPRIISGEDLISETAEISSAPLELSPEILIIDSADIWLKQLTPGKSGPFVQLVERLRMNAGKLILLSGTETQDLPCDDHVMSRIRAGFQVPLLPPVEEDLPDLLIELARQRGIRLKSRSLHFLLKNLRRNIPDLERYLERLLHLTKVLGKGLKFQLIADAIPGA